MHCQLTVAVVIKVKVLVATKSFVASTDTVVAKALVEKMIRQIKLRIPARNNLKRCFMELPPNLIGIDQQATKYQTGTNRTLFLLDIIKPGPSNK